MFTMTAQSAPIQPDRVTETPPRPGSRSEPRRDGNRVHLIEQILELNPSASMDFLGRFSDHALADYRDHLTAVQSPRGRGAVWVRPPHLPAIVVRADDE